MGRFAGLDEATRGFNSNPLKQGEFIVRIEGCYYFKSDTKGVMWKNDLTILAVIDGEHRVGEEVQTFFKRGDTAIKEKMFQQNLKGFLAGVTGAADEDCGDDDAELACAEDQSQNPLRGYVCRVIGHPRPHKTQKNDDGTPVVYTTYTWHKAMTPDEIREVLDAETIARFFPNGLGD